MCLIVSNSRKIKYFYKVFDLHYRYGYDADDDETPDLRAYYYSDYIYKAGYNYPDERFDVSKHTVIKSGVLHAYTSINKLDNFLISSGGVVIRFPAKKKDILCYGKNKEVGLRKLFIPKGLYERVVGCCKPNLVRNGIRIYW